MSGGEPAMAPERMRWKGAKLVLTCEGSLLVLRRDDIPTINWPGCWDLPGGAREGDETPDGPAWMTVWTQQDRVVTPPESARLEGAVQVPLQEVCPGALVDHGQLPRAPLVQAVVLQALSPQPLTAPGPDVCG